MTTLDGPADEELAFAGVGGLLELLRTGAVTSRGLVEMFLGDAAGELRQEQSYGDDVFDHGLLCSISQREYS